MSGKLVGKVVWGKVVDGQVVELVRRPDIIAEQDNDLHYRIVVNRKTEKGFAQTRSDGVALFKDICEGLEMKAMQRKYALERSARAKA